MEYRVDHDSMGEVKLPKNALYGAQTQRSYENFNIGTETMPLPLIKAYGTLKKACAVINCDLKFLSKENTQAIKKACDEIIEGNFLSEFPLKIWQTGSGTQTNMNVNEVIANRANQILGNALGSYSPIHPNDHVNFAQSTNDSFPTAMHIAIAMEIKNNLCHSLDELIKTLDKKSKDFANIVKMGRTHLQDATPITLGQEFSGYSFQLKECKKALNDNLYYIYQLAIGGSAVGTGLNTHPSFAKSVCELVSEYTRLPFVSSENKFAALAANDGCALLSGALNTLAVALMKIANDIRWLASGPRGGLCEITMQENEPGSSIMPGKVNPTQCEAITMIACQVMGNHTAVSIACSQGNFELNVFKPVIIRNILHSIEILSDGIKSFNEKCVQSIEPNLTKINELKTRSLMLVTALTPYIGYEKAAFIAKKAHKENKTLKEVCLELNIMSAKEFDERVLPEKMLAPNLKSKIDT